MENEDKLRLTGNCTELVQCQDAELPELIRDGQNRCHPPCEHICFPGMRLQCLPRSFLNQYGELERQVLC